jgi:hypothetical protein
VWQGRTGNRPPYADCGDAESETKPEHPTYQKAERVAPGYMTIESYYRKRYMYWDLSSQTIPLGPGGRIAIDCYEEEGSRSL